MLTFAGIGSRETPESVIPIIETLSKELISLGFTLRSGAADGSDLMWENAYDKYKGRKEIYLPWENFNKSESPLFDLSPEAREIAARFHPKWDELSETSRKFHTRNVYQVLGYNTRSLSEFLICWTPDAEEVGGTAQAMRIARYYNIPIFNLANENEMNRISVFVALNYMVLDKLY